MTIANSVRELAACPRCKAARDAHCNTKRGRNHTERVRAALREALAQEAETRGLIAEKLGLRGQVIPMKSVKMWIGNLDGDRIGLVIASSKEHARRIVNASRKEFEDYWVLQTGVDQGLEFELLYTKPIGKPGVAWTEGRCVL